MKRPTMTLTAILQISPLVVSVKDITAQKLLSTLVGVVLAIIFLQLFLRREVGFRQPPPPLTTLVDSDHIGWFGGPPYYYFNYLTLYLN